MSPLTTIAPQALFLLAGLFSPINLHIPAVGAEQTSFEVEKRVYERLEVFMGEPVFINDLTRRYREFDGFVNSMDARDRDAYLEFAWSLMTVNKYKQAIYYGLEDGLFLGYGINSANAWYREPGESGFDTENIPMDMAKYYGACVTKTGAHANCTMTVDDDSYYIQCIDGCSLEKCPDADSQRDCSAVPEGEERTKCEANIKWCKDYVRNKAPSDKTLGFVPRMYYCINKKGQPSQKKGGVLTNTDGTLGNCYYQDGTTLVDGIISGNYEYCGGDGQICNNTFLGAYRSRHYDPRWRDWYMETKAQQKRMWSDPYPFFTNLDIGITYSEPIYSMEDGKNVFKGVLAVDYTFNGITQFLKNAYFNTSTSVLICEDAEPHYIIGSSTGSLPARKVVSSNETIPCPDTVNADCTVVRVRVSELVRDEPMSIVLARAFAKHQEAGFPRAELLSVKATDGIGSDAYVSLAQIYEQPDANLKWRIIIVMPMDKATSDSVTSDNPLFGVLIFLGTLGFIICSIMMALWYRNRKERAVQLHDFRFTSAFILGCAILNWSTFTLLGPNTNVTCMLRMWSFHFLFVVALSPLLVKVWRLNKLVGERTSRHILRVSISHTTAALKTLPIILLQVLILTIFSIFDPPKQTESIETTEGAFVQHNVCARETEAFMIVQLIFESSLVIAGCVLAYMTRNLSANFGESKQLIAAMYNIAFIGLVMILAVNTMDVGEEGKSVLQAIGVFWGTVFSSCVFVLPRLMQVRRANRRPRPTPIRQNASRNVVVSRGALKDSSSSNT